MTEIDTSSYPKATMPVGPLDMAQKLGNIQQQKLGIDQAKLDQANQALTYMVRAMGSMGPDASKEDYAKAAQNAVDQGLVPQQQENLFLQHLQAAPDAPSFYKQFMSAAQQGQEQIAIHSGRNKDVQDNANIYSGVEKPAFEGGGFTPATKMPVQLPPTTPNVDNQRTLPNGQPNPGYNQPGYVGPSGPSGVAPAQPMARPRLPVAPPQGAGAVQGAQPLHRMPVAPPATTGPTGPTTQTGFNFKERFAGEPRVVSGAAPGVAEATKVVGEQSGKDYASDLTRAKNFQTDLYPMQKVLDIVKEEGPKAFGPGTTALTNLKSALVTWLPNVDQKTIDNVSNVEQARKYLVQAARTAGNTGTNDQLAAAFEANPNVTMSGATIDTVVKSNIALRKMQHAQTLLFGKQNLPDSEYSKWISQNQNVLDPRAFGFDMMDNKSKTKLVEQLGKGKAYKKFEDSLHFANEAGLIEPPARK